MDSYSIISNDRSILGESPVWDEKLQRIYWVDIEGKCLHAWSYIENQKLIVLKMEKQMDMEGFGVGL